MDSDRLGCARAVGSQMQPDQALMVVSTYNHWPVAPAGPVSDCDEIEHLACGVIRGHGGAWRCSVSERLTCNSEQTAASTMPRAFAVREGAYVFPLYAAMHRPQEKSWLEGKTARYKNTYLKHTL